MPLAPRPPGSNRPGLHRPVPPGSAPLRSAPLRPGPPRSGPLRSARVQTQRPTRNPFRRWWRRATDAGRSPLARAWTVLSGVVGLFIGLGIIGVLAVAAYAATLVARTPDAFALSEATQAQPSVVYAASGERLTQFEPAFQEWVPLDSIPGPLVDALIATEDRRFYEHGGVDVRRTVGALWATLRGRREGGSTVTQQLARNLFPAEIGRVGTPERKIKEMIAAVRIERSHTKREILESYLNTVPFLYNAHGVEMAARTYFGTHAPDLTVPQAATLVAMLKGPAEYNPVRRPEAALRRRNLVLRQMEEQGDLTLAEAAEARQSPLGVTLQQQPGTYSAAPHFTAAVRRAVEAWAVPRGYDVERDGLVIRTTLQMSAQRAAEAAVTERAERLQGTANREWRSGPPRAALDAALARTPAFARARESGATADEALRAVREDTDLVAAVREEVVRVESALVAIEPATGAVRAYVGSRDFAHDEFDHAGVARRQPGSTFKAFVYACALQRGYAPDDVIEGGAAEVRLGDGTTWRPEGGSSGGTLADALAFSKNAVAVRLTQEVGAHRVALVAQRMGITSPLDIVPSLGLGTSPVTLLEMVGAYGAIANDGLVRAPRLVTQIETAGGHVLERFAGEGPQALTRRDARLLLDMMRGTIDRGTGKDLRGMGVTGDLAGKTGTTQRYADGWFIAMRPGIVVGAWVGFNDQRVAFRSMATGAGGATALPVVGAFLRRVQGSLPDVRFPGPDVYDDPYADEAPEDAPDGPELAGDAAPEWTPPEDDWTPPEPVETPVEKPEPDTPRLRSDIGPSDRRPPPGGSIRPIRPLGGAPVGDPKE
ncbi:MAG TPA: transglycosylase domain-containing protein [Rubricoccaceae bacterium]